MSDSSDNNMSLRSSRSRQDSYTRSCPQTEMERLKAQYKEGKLMSHNSSQLSTNTSGVQLHHPHRQQQHLEQQRGQSFTNNSSWSSMSSSLTDMSLDKLSPASSPCPKVVQPPVSHNISGENYDASQSKPGLHHTSWSSGPYHRDTFTRSCPQTEMERLKYRYLKGASQNVGQGPTNPSDVGGVQLLERSQHYHSLDSDDDEDVSLYLDSFSDISLDLLSPPPSSPSSKVIQPPTPYNFGGESYDAPQSRPGLHHKSWSGGSYHRDTFARSCPQTEMERMKEEYFNDNLSHVSRQLRPEQPQKHLQNHLKQQPQYYHQQHHQQQQQHIRSYNSEEDDDVLLLNFNSPTKEASLSPSNSPSSKVIQPPTPHNFGGESYDAPQSRPGLHHKSWSGGSYHRDTFARSCPQTEMERLKAHYMKEKMSNSSFDNMMYGSQSRNPNFNSGYTHFFPPRISEQSTSSPLQGLNRSMEGHRAHSGNSGKIAPECPDHFGSDQKLTSRKSPQHSKELSKTTNSRDYKDLPNDLGVFSIDCNCSFSNDAQSSEREAVFERVKQSKAQIILMSNTGLRTDEQLQLVRAEVKTFFLSCESAMWASFPVRKITEPTLDGADDEEQPQQTSHKMQTAGRGVIILVLGPLAPRTGWIKSDVEGYIISASARIKPNLPVLTFIACDFGGITTDKKQIDHPSMLFLYELIRSEYDKDNLIIMGGKMSGDIYLCPPNSHAFCSIKETCTWIESGGVNVSIVCDSSVPHEISGSFPGDVLVCQKKKTMTILGVELSKNDSMNDGGDDGGGTSPCLVKMNILGWPKKSFAIQLKAKPSVKADMPSNNGSNKWSKKTSMSPTVAQISSRQKMVSALLAWQQHLQDFSHSLQGILHAKIDQSVQSNCLKQLVTDILNRAHADTALIDTPGFASSSCLNRLSALLPFSDCDFLASAAVVEEIIAGLVRSAVSSITSN